MDIIRTRSPKPAPKPNVPVYPGTVAVTKPARLTTMTFVVPSTAAIRVDGVAATLADVEVGDAVDVKGVQQASGFSVTALNVTSPPPVVVEPAVPVEPPTV